MPSFKAIALLATVAVAYKIPDNLQEIYDKYKSRECSNKLATDLTDGRDDPDQILTYCGDIDGAIFLHSAKDGGSYANMDIDCDGANNEEGDCGDDNSGQSPTAFMDDLEDFGIDNLDAHIHPYVVFGNDDLFDPQEYGMEPLSVMAVVCNDQLYYGIWGDENGGDSTGEAALSMGQLCFPDDGITGDSGHDEEDVLYIGFIGKKAVPGSDADWTADNVDDFEESIKDLGDELVASLSA